MKTETLTKPKTTVMEKNKINIKSDKFIDVVVKNEPSLKTNKSLFDKWFSADGGMVLGSSIFVSGTSGAGKTTLMINIMNWAKNIVSSMYSREMEGFNVKKQTIDVLKHGNAYIADRNACKNFNEYLDEINILKPKIVIIDSLQVIAKEDYPDMSEADACYLIIDSLRKYVSKYNAILFLIGHNTKDGNFAGVNTIMQMMDAHMELIHNKKENSRTISWGQKNRKGPMGNLYYVIKKDEIDFFTKEEWNIIKKTDRNFVSVVNDTINSYINSVILEKEQFKQFKDECNSGILNLFNSNKNDLDFTIESIKFVNKLAEKYKV